MISFPLSSARGIAHLGSATRWTFVFLSARACARCTHRGGEEAPPVSRLVRRPQVMVKEEEEVEEEEEGAADIYI